MQRARHLQRLWRLCMFCCIFASNVFPREEGQNFIDPCGSFQIFARAAWSWIACAKYAQLKALSLSESQWVHCKRSLCFWSKVSSAPSIWLLCRWRRSHLKSGTTTDHAWKRHEQRQRRVAVAQTAWQQGGNSTISSDSEKSVAGSLGDSLELAGERSPWVAEPQSETVQTSLTASSRECKGMCCWTCCLMRAGQWDMPLWEPSFASGKHHQPWHKKLLSLSLAKASNLGRRGQCVICWMMPCELPIFSFLLLWARLGLFLILVIIARCKRRFWPPHAVRRCRNLQAS